MFDIFSAKEDIGIYTCKMKMKNGQTFSTNISLECKLESIGNIKYTSYTSYKFSELLFEYNILTLMLLNCWLLFFIHSKLELLTQFIASNDETEVYL